MKPNKRTTATCPLCGQIYIDHPAISRADNETLICPDCGTREALQGLGIDATEQDKIIESIHRCKAKLD